MKLVHGGDWESFRISHGGKMPLDFSANTSPLGLPDGVKEAIVDSLTYADRYPDPLCRELRKKIEEKTGIPKENILCGNGAADLIFRLASAKKPKKALITAPTFAEYRTALEASGCAVYEYALREENGFEIREDILELLGDETDVVFICEPNNPTGKTTAKPLIEKILEKCRKTGTLLVLDECFVDFLDEPEKHTMSHEIDGGNLFILKAFTKFYGMAGVRLGYCLCADKGLLEAMAKSGQPWGVSTMAQAAGIAALSENEYSKKLLETVSEGREYLLRELKKLGFKVIDGEANFILFKTENISLGDALSEKGILLRDCSNYSGLEKGWYRTAVRGIGDCEKLISGIKEVMK